MQIMENKFDKELAKFDPQVAELQKIADSSKEITITDFSDKAQVTVVKEKRIELKGIRVAIKKKGKALREEANAFNNAVLEKEKEMIGVIEPEEKRLSDLEDEAKEKAEIEKRKETLPSKKEMLNEIGDEVGISDEDLLQMTEDEFVTYVNNRTANWNTMQSERIEREEKEAKEKREKEDEDRKKEDDKRRKELADQQAEIDKENAAKEAEIEKDKAKVEADKKKLEDDKKDLEHKKDIEKAKEEAKKKAEKEAKEKAEEEEKKKKEEEAAAKKKKEAEAKKLAEEKKYQEFLTEMGYSEETNDDFYFEEHEDKVVLYKKVGTYKK